jgi:hypothetical protein
VWGSEQAGEAMSGASDVREEAMALRRQMRDLRKAWKRLRENLS